MREYDEQKVKSWYVWNNYFQLLDQKYVIYAKFLVSDPESRPVRMLLKEQFEELHMQYGRITLNQYVEIMANKIQLEHAAGVIIQRCPQCQKIVITPIAEQCNWCGAEWRGQNPLRSEWEKSRK